MPSMRGEFTTPCGTVHDHTTAQVRGGAEGWVVGRREVARSAVSGISLARTPAWSARHESPDEGEDSAPGLAACWSPGRAGWATGWAIGCTVVVNAERAKDAAEAYRSGDPLVNDLNQAANPVEGAMA
jgi:hypothetical protein